MDIAGLSLVMLLFETKIEGQIGRLFLGIMKNAGLSLVMFKV